MNNELQNIKSFFTERRQRCLSVKRLEEEAGIPAKTLDHFIKGRRMLPAYAIDKLIPVLVDFGYKPLADQFLKNFPLNLLFKKSLPFAGW